MKLLILSDSHGDITSMERIADIERPDGVIHLGDHASDAKALARKLGHISVCMVRGNCDSDSDVAEEHTLDFGGHTFYITHGHRQNVKSGLLALKYRAEEAGAELALFGHTHIAHLDLPGGVRLMNPGSARRVLWQHARYGLVIIDDDGLRCELKTL